MQNIIVEENSEAVEIPVFTLPKKSVELKVELDVSLDNIVDEIKKNINTVNED